MKLVINIPKEAVVAAVSLLKMSGEGDFTDVVEESDSLIVELSDKELKPLVGNVDYTTGMMGLAGYGLLTLKKRRENESKGN